MNQSLLGGRPRRLKLWLTPEQRGLKQETHILSPLLWVESLASQLRALKGPGQWGCRPRQVFLAVALETDPRGGQRMSTWQDTAWASALLRPMCVRELCGRGHVAGTQGAGA